MIPEQINMKITSHAILAAAHCVEPKILPMKPASIFFSSRRENFSESFVYLISLLIFSLPSPIFPVVHLTVINRGLLEHVAR